MFCRNRHLTIRSYLRIIKKIQYEEALMRRSNILWMRREGPVGARPCEGECEGSLGAADRTQMQVDSAGSPPLLGQKHVSAL